MNDKKLFAMYKECKVEIETVLGVKLQSINIFLTDKLKSTLGTCLDERWGYTIDINKKFFHHSSISDDRKKSLIIHEILHTLENDGCHTPKFNDMAKKMETATGLIDICGGKLKEPLPTEYYKDTYKWSLECVSCGSTSYRNKLFGGVDSNNISKKYICVCKDNGRLRVTKNN